MLSVLPDISTRIEGCLIISSLTIFNFSFVSNASSYLPNLYFGFVDSICLITSFKSKNSSDAALSVFDATGKVVSETASFTIGAGAVIGGVTGSGAGTTVDAVSGGAATGIFAST